MRSFNLVVILGVLNAFGAAAGCGQAAAVYPLPPDHEIRIRGGVRALVYAPDGNSLIGTTSGPLAIRWNATTGATVAKYGITDRWIQSLAVSPDGKIVALGGQDGKLSVWKMDGDSCIHQSQKGSDDFNPIHSLSFSSDGTRLLCATRRAIYVLRVSDWGEAAVIPANVGLARFSHDGLLVYSANYGYGGRIKVSKVEGGDLVWTDPRDAMRVGVHAVEWSPDNAWLCSIYGSGHIRILDSKIWALSRCLDVGFSHADTLAFSGDGSRMATAGYGGGYGRVVVWETQGWQLLRVRDWVKGKELSGVAIRPAGDQVAACSEDGVAIWDLPGKMPAGENEIWPGLDRRIKGGPAAGPVHAFQGHLGWVTRLVFSGNGKWLASAGADGTVRVWALQTRAEIRTFRGHAQHVLFLAWTRDGTRLISGGADGRLIVWQMATSDRAWEGSCEGAAGTCFTLSNDEQFIAAGDEKGSVHVWHLGDGRLVGRYQAGATEIGKIEFISNNQRLKITMGDCAGSEIDFSSGGSVKILNAGMTDDEKERRGWEKHEMPCAYAREDTAASIFPYWCGYPWIFRSSDNAQVDRLKGDWQTSGGIVVVQSDDGALAAGLGGFSPIPVWRLPDGNVLRKLDPPPVESYFSAGAFSRDHRWLARGDGQGLIWLWEAESPRD